MTDPADNQPVAAIADEDRDLVLTRLIDVPRDALFRAWTDPKLLVQWFAPAPWSTVAADLDVRPGGTSRIVMRAPDGTEYPSQGVYLEVVENARLVFTDAYSEAWKPSQKPFMTVILTFEDEGGKTRYTARAWHWTTQDRDAHEKMGFHDGWGQCADQLAAVAARLCRSLAAHPSWRRQRRHEPWSTIIRIGNLMETTRRTGRLMRMAGSVLTGLVSLFLVFDGAIKLAPMAPVTETLVQLGYSADPSLARFLGVITLACTFLYIVPRTSVLGAILLTGYLGGAMAMHLRVGSPVFTHLLFGLYLGLMIWGGLWFRDARIRTLLPLRSPVSRP